ncbi:MAG TPA: bacillithiol biosynthesis cysteine-adding enzyme BshC [Terriglobales bacterium]|nr:bacillithiol biosynthesis cysteine-adding enzyme BshC [Terriglobales bacterium]
MKTHCLPFAQVPHTTRLFLDYLSYTPLIREFYPRSPLFPEWVKEEAARVRYDDGRRKIVADTLDKQNRTFGAGAKTFANIERLKQGAFAAVTGQQVGLFGGPLFSIFKALTAVKLAEEATAAGVDCVPIFWLATEDHDLAEVNHVALISEAGIPEKLAVDSHGLQDAPVGTVTLGSEIPAVVERAAALFGDTEVAIWLRESYRPEETMGSAFARLMARLFADWGVILLDQSDAAFHQLAKPILRQAVERSGELDDALLERGKALESAGYHQQVKVTPATTLLFEIKDGARTVVRRKTNGMESEFAIGDERSFAQQLLDRIDSNPGSFSPNVLLRPIVQDYLLPTLAYTGGAAEVAYFAQVAVVYEKLLGRVTPVLPRFSATVVEPKPQRLLEKYRLALPDLFQGPEKLREIIATRTLPSDLQGRFDEAKVALEKSLNGIREALARLDSTLVDAASNAEEKMKYQLTQLEARAARAEVQRNDVITRHAESLSSALYPNKALQEREIAGVSFVARYGPELLHNLYEAIHTDCHDHQVVEIG